jgi:hypothetical protein
MHWLAEHGKDSKRESVLPTQVPAVKIATQWASIAMYRGQGHPHGEVSAA